MLLFALSSMKQQIRIFFTAFADQNQVIAFHVSTVFKIAGFALTVGAFADCFDFVTKLHCHAVVEHSQ